MLIPLLASLAFAVDTDLDGVDNFYDECPYEDDKVDIDADGAADCAQTLLWEFGFADEASLHYYSDESLFGGGNLVWGHDDDLNGYDAYSGAAMISNGTGVAILEVDKCVPLDHTKRYVITGRFGVTLPDTAKANYVLSPIFYFDPSCAQEWPVGNIWGTSSSSHFSYTVTYGSHPYEDLVLDFSTPPSANAMRIRAYSYTDGYAPRFWFDSIAVHEEGKKGGPADHPTGPPDKR